MKPDSNKIKTRVLPRSKVRKHYTMKKRGLRQFSRSLGGRGVVLRISGVKVLKISAQLRR